MRAVTPAVYSPHLAAGTSFALSDANAPVAYSGEDLKDVSAFGAGVALHRGPFSSTHDITRLPLAIRGSDDKAVDVGALEPVLTASDSCTGVLMMAPLGTDLLLGLSDKNGTRLVRLQKSTP